MMHITEDTPPDMLAGAMDLTVHLPTGRSVKMSVERSTPMMDLLVQITTAHHLQLSGYIIQALGMAPSAEHSDKILPYKPSTPIGALDTQHIKVIPKGRTLPVAKNVLPGRQPFESTFRLKVHLPRNQLYVCRVSRNVHLEDIMKKVCDEKNLDPLKYECRHPGNLDEVLDPKLTLNDYQITEIHIVSKGTVTLMQAFSSSDIMALRKEEERKQMQAKTGGGVFNLIFKRGKNSMGSGSLSSENRSISPTHSDDSRSLTPPAIQQPILPPVQKNTTVERPKPPQRKRRPAPKPPQNIPEVCKTPTEKPPSEISSESNTLKAPPKKVENELTICHSRNSSDSSGYHEASVLSDNYNTTLPRRPKSTVVNESDYTRISGKHSKSTGNLSKFKSTSSLALAGRKKKAAPPPPPVLKAASSISDISKPSPVVASQPLEEQTLKEQHLEKVECEPSPKTPVQKEVVDAKLAEPALSEIQEETEQTKESLSIMQTPRESIGSIQPPSHSPSPPPSSRKSSCCGDDDTFTTETIMKEAFVEKNNLQKLSNVNDSGIDISMELKVEADLDIDWQYPLPSPPKAFRDSSPPSTTDTLNYDTRTIEDSVVTSPELFEQLKPVEDAQSEIASDITSVISEEDKQMCNKLTLENLEKRKSLVYNRELATSLKYSDEKEENVAIKHSDVLNELENVIQNQKVSTLSRQNSRAQEAAIQTSDRNLPNFKITTYDNPKKKINIFEDDSVRSNEPLPIAESRKSLDSHNEFKSLNPLSSKDRCESSSSDNISFRKHSFDSQSENEIFKKPQDYPRRKVLTNYLTEKEDSSNSVTRSESFSVDNWKPSNPVKRSKSQVALNRHKEDTRTRLNEEDNLSKSNSLYDLQSLGVIRMIQTKLNTPTNSSEELDRATEHEATTKKTETNYEVKQTAPKPAAVNRGPPAINLSTWSERPKKQVLLKEDTDYKINNSKDYTANFVNSNDYPKVNSSFQYSNQITTNNVTIKVNGSEAISTEKMSNLVIKIGGGQNENVTFRKPLGNVNKIETKSRPHSIAFDSNFDISRVPIVRSVELKKPFKDNPTINNKSSTQVNYTNTNTNTNGLDNNYTYNSKDCGPVSFSAFTDNKFATNRFSETYRSSENLNSKSDGNRSNVYINSDPVSKPVIRVNSFVQNTPVVRGFRDNNTINRKSWTPVNTYGTLPLKPVNQNQTDDDDDGVNKNVPFAQPVLRKVESSRCFNNFKNSSNNPIFGNVVLRNIPQKYNNEHRNSMGSIVSNKINSEAVQPPPPPPPVLPKNCNFTKKPLETEVSPRDQMLSEIRNFGGKKGLKSIKA